MSIKRCSKCKTYKDTIMFHDSSREKDGKQSWCISCRYIHRKKVKPELENEYTHVEQPTIGEYSLGEYREVKAISTTELENGKIEVILPSRV